MKSLVQHITRMTLGALLLPALLFIQGCGGDEGTLTGPLDNTLRVLAVNPQPGETNVPSITTVELRMNMALATSTVTNKFKVSSVNTGGIIQGTTTFEENDTVIRFTPQNNGQLPGNTQIKIELLQGVQSIGGQQLANTFTSIFTTGNGIGFGSTSKPGVAPTITDVSPDAGSILSYGAIGSGQPMIIFRFSECVNPIQFKQALVVQYEEWPDLGIFGTEGELWADVLTDGYTDNTLYIALSQWTGAMPNPAKIKVKVNDYFDCDGDQSENTPKSYSFYAY